MLPDANFVSFGLSGSGGDETVVELGSGGGDTEMGTCVVGAEDGAGSVCGGGSCGCVAAGAGLGSGGDGAGDAEDGGENGGGGESTAAAEAAGRGRGARSSDCR
jgi:hypothetical protein